MHSVITVTEKPKQLKLLQGLFAYGFSSSSTNPQPNPLTLLLSTTLSPICTLFFITMLSLQIPCSNAYLRVVPKLPPHLAAGVIHSPSRRKYGVVILPSMISPLWFTSKISASKGAAFHSDFSDELGNRARMSSYCVRLVVLWLVNRLGEVLTGETKMWKLGGWASSSENEVGKRELSSTAGTGVEVTFIAPPWKTITRSCRSTECIAEGLWLGGTYF